MVDELGGEPARGRVAPYETWQRAGAEEPPGPGPAERAAGALGALTSLALVAGLGLWTYDLAMRDLSAVPVVRALEGPARVAPDEPGGEVARHQGLAVNTIQGDQDEAPAPERVVLAPATPDLAEDDRAPAADLAADLAERPGRSLGIAAPPGAPILLASAEVGVEEGPWGGVGTDAPAAADPLRAALAEALALPEPEAAVASVVPAGALVVSPRPSGRPPRPVAAASEIARPVGATPETARPAATTSEIARPAAATPEIAPAALPAGTQLVQIGAFATAEDARGRWADLALRHAAFLAGKAPVIEAASSGGHRFWRLRAAGFADGADANRVCAALAAEGVECVPVRVR